MLSIDSGVGRIIFYAIVSYFYFSDIGNGRSGRLKFKNFPGEHAPVPRNVVQALERSLASPLVLKSIKVIKNHSISRAFGKALTSHISLFLWFWFRHAPPPLLPLPRENCFKMSLIC